jgi:hypothetical protein
MTEPNRAHRRPAFPGPAHFESLVGDEDPSVRSDAADRCATLLVRGAHGADDEQVVERIVRLGETEGLDTLAELWSGSPADSVAGCLWRLYLLRAWVYADPMRAAHEFEAGRRHTPVQVVVAGVVEPPGPDEVRHLADEVLRGVVRGDFADTLFRAAAFARVTASGRARQGDLHTAERHASDLSAARLLTMAEQLERAGHLELEGRLG